LRLSSSSAARGSKGVESGHRGVNGVGAEPSASTHISSVKAGSAEAEDLLGVATGIPSIAGLVAGRPAEVATPTLSATTGASSAVLSSGVGGAAGLAGLHTGGSPGASPVDARLITDAHVATPMDQPGFVPAFSARIATLVRDGVEQARIRLHPLDMGPVAVQMALDGTQVRVDLAAEVAATRQLLEQSLPSLAGALREAGFTLSGGGVFQQSRQGFGGEPSASSRPGSATDDRSEAAEDIAPARLGSLGRPSRGLVDVFA
jgi:flagellar hook-length control protein FliK